MPGLPAIVKSGGGGCAFTTKLTVVVCVKLPLVPLIVSVDVPTGVLPLVVTVSVDVPVPVTVAGEKPAVAPAGNPLALSATAPVNPFKAPMLVVYVVALPTIIERDEGEAVIEKSGTVLTVIFRVGGLGSVAFALSVTVSIAVYVPAVE